MSLDVWDAERLRSVITPELAVEALRRRLVDDPPSAARAIRTRQGTAAGTLLLMPDESSTHVGVKVVSLVAGNPALGRPAVQGAYLLMDAATNSPLAVLDAAELTLVRTAAVSMLAISHLHHAESPRVVVVGGGPQAVAHADAALCVLGASSVRAVVRSAAGAERCSALARERGVVVSPAGAEALREADVIVCATSSQVPVIADADVRADAVVVVAIGVHEPGARELPGELVGRSFVVVESRDAARAEAGDVVLAEAELGRAVVAADLGELVRGAVRVPVDRPRVFKSVGEAWEDLAVAALVDGI
jgi:ornithine cyclodeaminase